MNISKHIETGSNIATITLAALLGVILVRGGIPREGNSATFSSGRQVQPAPRIGLDLAKSPISVDWAANKRTLVLGLQTGCHFCTESAPFFQKLAAAAAGGTKIVAVLPQSLGDSKQYLAKLSVHVDEIRSAPLADITVIGTPTMLLVDGKGIVRNVWVGKLSEDRQSEVLSAIEPKP